MTTKFNIDDTGFVPVRIRSISISEAKTIRYNVEVVSESLGQICFSIKEECLIKTPEDLKNYIIEEGGENEDE